MAVLRGIRNAGRPYVVELVKAMHVVELESFLYKGYQFELDYGGEVYAKTVTDFAG